MPSAENSFNRRPWPRRLQHGFNTVSQHPRAVHDRSTNGLSRRIREVLPDILAVYPDAKVEQTRHGLLLKPSKPSVPTTMVNGYRLVEAEQPTRLPTRTRSV